MSQEKQWYEIRSITSDVAEIFIYERIGMDYWSGEGITAKGFLEELGTIKSKQINLHVNSPGGSVFDATAIYNGLKNHPANVTTYIDGVAASAASIVALAGDKVVIASNALYMIHNPMTYADGNANELRKVADLLDKVRDTMTTVYMEKTTLTNEELLAALDAETWYNADEAIAAGFASEKTQALDAAASIDFSSLQAMGYKRIPATNVVAGITKGETQVSEPTATSDTTVDAVVVATQEVTAAATRVGNSFTKPRSPIVNGATYLEHTLKASLGNEDSRQYVAFTDDTFTTNSAFDQVTYLNSVIDPSTKFGRPTIDAFGGTVSTKFVGQTVSVPKVTTDSTVTVEAENGTTEETGIISSFVTADVKKYAGMQTFSQELLDLSGSPVFYDMMLKNLAAAYAKATNAAVIAEAVSGGTAGTNQAATAAGMIAFHATESAAAYLATGDFAQSYIAGSSQWVLAMAAVDSTGRPIFNAGQPANSAGSIGGTSARGKFLDLDFYADRSMVATTIDDSAFIVVPSAMLLLEQAPQKLQVAVLGSGQYEVSLHGYLAAKTLIAGGIRRFNIA